MTDSRKIVKVFLASPGDLRDERLAAKSEVDEFNKIWADHLGYHVELVGWEDTGPIYGRPQATINRDLERCELFIGMMWKRWGTPPDDSGQYTSGFEEEFQISITNREKKGSPEISLFFKNVDHDLLHDPGDELKKVLKFKTKIIEQKLILFETFDGIEDFRRKILRCVTRYVQEQISKGTRENTGETQARSSEDIGLQNQLEPTSTSEKLFSVEGARFLQDLISKTERDAEQDPITTAEVARFRLLASIVGDPWNDSQVLGVHDANNLFAHRSDLKLSSREQIGLINSGLEHYSSESTPLWYWLAEFDALDQNWLQTWSAYGTTERRVGALSAMRLVSQVLSSEGPWDKEACMKSWFSEDAPSALTVAVLRYLADCGTAAHLTAITEEMDRGDYQTTSAAVDAILRINFRDSREKAINSLFELQPASIDPSLLGALFENSASISTEVLSQGVGHQSSAVRRMVVKLLSERGALDVEIADQLTSDSDSEVRYEALQSLFYGGRQFSDDEAKKILVMPKKGLLAAFGMYGTIDSEGEAFWNQFCERRMAAMTDRDLKRAANDSLIFDMTAQFVLSERQFFKFGNSLREAVDDHFKAKISKDLEKMEQKFSSESDLVEKARTFEEQMRKEFTRKGLDIICRKGEAQDLGRVRNIMNSGFVDYSDADIEYLGKFGEWEERLIPLPPPRSTSCR